MEGVMATIMLFAGNFAPRNWMFCDGRSLSIAEFSALYSLLGATYGGDGRTTFALPDLQGRGPIGAGHGPGLNPVTLGELGGEEQTRLQMGNLPSHSHPASLNEGTIRASSASADDDDPAGRTLAVTSITARGVDVVGNIYGSGPDASMAAGIVTGRVEVGAAGGNLPFSNRPPYTGLNYVICVQGIYPSRS